MNQEIEQNPKKKQSLNLSELTTMLKPLGVLFKRHLVLIFIVLTLLALIYAVVTVNTILQQGSTTADTATNKYDTRFDQATIDKINQLSNRDQTPSVSLPSGRINPFSE